MNLERATVEVCGERLDLAIFTSERTAAEHIRKHVLDPAQRWEAMVPADDLARARREGDGPALDRVYGVYAAEIRAGLRLGARVPLHAHLERQERARADWRACYELLSWRGVRIFADERGVRTAYRKALRRQGHQDYAYFARAWFDLATQACATAPRSAGADRSGTEFVRRACLRSFDHGPPTIVEWRALGAGQAPAEGQP